MTDSRAFFYVDGDPLKGLWFDLDTATGTDEVLEALAEGGYIPRGEDGAPEYGGDLLVADAEGLARQFLGKYGTFDMAAFIECRDHRGDDEAKAAYVECFGDWDGAQFDERYRGKWDSWEDMARELLDETGELQAIPERLRYYFDYEAYARDIRLGGDMIEHGGHFFWNH